MKLCIGILDEYQDFTILLICNFLNKRSSVDKMNIFLALWVTVLYKKIFF